MPEQRFQNEASVSSPRDQASPVPGNDLRSAGTQSRLGEPAQSTDAKPVSPSGLYDRDGNPVLLVVETKTKHGTVRRAAPFATFAGRPSRYYEYISDARWNGVPWVHVAGGRHPETGRVVVAKGVVAIGQFAVGGIAVGQIAVGIVTVAQLGIGGMAAFGQVVVGAFAAGQLAVAVKAAIGMLAVGSQAVGMFTAGGTCLGGESACAHQWTARRADPVAVQTFQKTPFRPFRVNNKSSSYTTTPPPGSPRRL
ncbi:MAG: hypothetical protein ACOVT5_00725 [Armatimonadaceae bacterium]|jgi:hypothetical protein